jgi:predicted transcriptional regulator
MENNHRPVSSTVMLGLAGQFGLDVTELSSGDAERLVSDMREALADPVLAGDPPPLADLRLVASNAPAVAHALLKLHRSYRQPHERLASLDEALGRDDTPARPSAWEEVRDFFHYCDSYIDAVDRAAENFASQTGGLRNVRVAAVTQLGNHDVRLRFEETDVLRSYHPDKGLLTISAYAAPATQTFQLLLQVALLTQDALLEATLDLTRFHSSEARAIAKIGLANYFAGAALLFFFIRVDQAGTIAKRHSATRLQFARFGGARPFWNVHRAFETPGQLLRQLAETPDEVRYVSIVRDVSKPAGRFGAPVRRFAIALGCEVAHAGELVYADGLDVGRADAFEPIGISCRICDCVNCHQCAVPPLERPLRVDPDLREVLPYSLL